MELSRRDLRGRWVRVLKACWLGFWVTLATIVVFIPVVVGARVDASQRAPDWICRMWARTILMVTGVRRRSKGVEKIEPGRSYAIIVNHQSHFDVLALVLELPLCIRWVFKKEFKKVPLFGYAVSSMRNIAVDRSDSASARRSLEEGVRRLPAGASLLFFAEGTRSPDGKIGAFKKGGFHTAQAVGWPILPVVVHGSRRLLPRGTLAFRSGTIEVEVLDPIPSEQVLSTPYEQLVDRVRREIVECFEKREAQGIRV